MKTFPGKHKGCAYVQCVSGEEGFVLRDTAPNLAHLVVTFAFVSPATPWSVSAKQPQQQQCNMANGALRAVLFSEKCPTPNTLTCLSFLSGVSSQCGRYAPQEQFDVQSALAKDELDQKTDRHGVTKAKTEEASAMTGLSGGNPASR